MADRTAGLSRGPVLLSFSLATASFALATTFVRFYIRRGLRGGLGPDDSVSGAATVLALIGTVFAVLEGTASSPTLALQFNTVGPPWCILSAMLSKTSMCLFFMSLLRRARPWRLLLAGLVLVMAVINLAFVLAQYLQCLPLEKVWDPLRTGSCSDPSIQANLGYTQGAFSVFSWVFLGLFLVLVARDITRGGEPSWPLYAASVLSMISAIFVIARTAQISQTAGARTYTVRSFMASLMANLEQNTSLISSNILAFGSLFSPSSSTITATTSTISSSRHSRNGNHNRNRSRKPRRDPYSSASSAGTNHSRRSGKSKRTLASTSASRSVPSRASSSRSINRPDTRASSRPGSSSSDLHHHMNPDLDGAEGAGNEAAGRREIDLNRTTHLIIGGPGPSLAEPPRQRDGERVRQKQGGRHPSRRDGPGASDRSWKEEERERRGEEEEEEIDLGDARSRYPHQSQSQSQSRNPYPYPYLNHGDSESEEGEYTEFEYDDDDNDNDDGDEGESDANSTSGSDIDLEAWPRGIIKTVSVEIVEEVNEEYVAAVAAAAAAAAAAAGGSAAGSSGSGAAMDTAAAAIGGRSSAGSGGSGGTVAATSSSISTSISTSKEVGRNKSAAVVSGTVGIRQHQHRVGVSVGAGGPGERFNKSGGNGGIVPMERISEGSGTIEQDWETMLRAGPPR